MKKKSVKEAEHIAAIKYKLEYYTNQYNDYANKFCLMVQNGTALTNYTALDTIRALNVLYDKLAAYHDVLESLEKLS